VEVPSASSQPSVPSTLDKTSRSLLEQEVREVQVAQEAVEQASMVEQAQPQSL
jgi:hypothetical protein